MGGMEDIAERLIMDFLMESTRVSSALVKKHVGMTNPHVDYARNALYHVPFDSHQWTGPTMVPLSQIRHTGAPSETRVKRYIKKLKAWSPLPAVVLVKQDQALHVADGSHRVEAALRSGHSHITAYIGTPIR